MHRDISEAKRVTIFQFVRPRDADVVDESAVGAGRVLQKDLGVSTDQECVIPGDGGLIDDDIVVVACAQGVVSLPQRKPLRRFVRVVEITVYREVSLGGLGR